MRGSFSPGFPASGFRWPGILKLGKSIQAMARADVLNLAVRVLVTIAILAGLVATLLFFQLKHEVEHLKAEAAEAQSSKAITTTALNDLQDVLRQPIETPEQTCYAVRRLREKLLSLTSAQRDLLPTDIFTIAANICATTEGGRLSPGDEATRKFVDSYIDAVGARVTGDYKTAKDKYEAALSVQNAPAVDAQWRMRALEGIANAQLHLKDYPAAQQSLDNLEALRSAENKRLKTDYMFVFEGLTKVKIMCRTHASATSIRQALGGLRTEFDTYKRTRTDDYHKAWATKDRQFVEDDAEMFYFCNYAGVRPITPP